MNHVPRLLQAMTEPLVILPSVGRSFARLMAHRLLTDESLTGAKLHADLGIPEPDERPATPQPARIAVIPIYGVIDRHPQSLGTSTERIGAMVDQAMARSDIEGILFDVDSPGGTVGGTPELAAKIFAARGKKPMLALANGLMASAAYWIGSAADEVWVTPSGDVGSIGVYTVHEDWSESLKQDGVKVTPISYGKYKLEGAPWEPLSDEARERLQARVDAAGTWFTKDVAAHRGDTPAAVRAGYGQGRVLSAKEAVTEKLADKVGTFAEAVTRLSKMVKRGPSAAARERSLALDAMKR